MSRPRNTIPKFSVDRNGRAFTKVDGRFISLGRGDDPRSSVRYAEVLMAHTAGESIAATAPAILQLQIEEAKPYSERGRVIDSVAEWMTEQHAGGK